jgi:hypothetical protein
MLELEEIIAVWAQMELKEKEERRRKSWVHHVICDGRKNGLFWTVFEDLRRDEAKFF